MRPKKLQAEALGTADLKRGNAAKLFTKLFAFDIRWFYKHIGRYSHVDYEREVYGDDDDEDILPTLDYCPEEAEETETFIDDGYDFDEDDEDYRTPGSMLHHNCDRDKYFA